MCVLDERLGSCLSAGYQHWIYTKLVNFYFLPLRRMAMQGMVKVEDESMGLWTDVEWSTDIFLEPKEV